MPRITFGGGKDLAKATLGEVDAYDEALLGVPPKGIYRLRIKRLVLKKNRNNDWMLNAVGEIAEPKDSAKAKYNAYGSWFNLNVNEKGAKGVNNFLLAISGGSQVVVDKFWTVGARVSEDKLKPVVLAIGPLKINPDGMMAHALMKHGTNQSGAQELKIDRFLMRNGAPEESDIDEDGDDEIIVVSPDDIDGDGQYAEEQVVEADADVDGNYVGDGSDAGGSVDSDDDDYADEPVYVEEAPVETEETAEAAQEQPFDDEPPF